MKSKLNFHSKSQIVVITVLSFTRVFFFIVRKDKLFIKYCNSDIIFFGADPNIGSIDSDIESSLKIKSKLSCTEEVL